MDALTKVLVSLYEEPDKPDDAIEWVIKTIELLLLGHSIKIIQ